MLSGMKRKATGRIYRTTEEIEALVAEFRQQDVSARQFALEHKISPASFRNWLGRQGTKRTAQPRWVEVVGQTAGVGPIVTVEVPNGLKLHVGAGFSAEPVARLVRLLHQP